MSEFRQYLMKNKGCFYNVQTLINDIDMEKLCNPKVVHWSPEYLLLNHDPGYGDSGKYIEVIAVMTFATLETKLESWLHVSETYPQC